MKLPLVLLCVVMSTAVCAPRGDISEEEDDKKPRYVEVKPLPAIKKIVDKVKEIVGSKNIIINKLKKPLQIVEDIKDKIHEKKGHQWTKISPQVITPSSGFKPVYETMPCVYYPQIDMHYTPPLPYYFY